MTGNPFVGAVTEWRTASLERVHRPVRPVPTMPSRGDQ